MMFFSAWGRGLLVLSLVILATGCGLTGDGSQDEEKESNYLQGKRRQLDADYEGAVKSYEKALEANPRSSAAHLELGLLYAGELSRNAAAPGDRNQARNRQQAAAAIYHLEKFLQLKPDSLLADRVRGQISACELEIARTVSFTLLSSTVQNELERLNATNATLLRQIDHHKLQLAQQAYAYSNQLAGAQQRFQAALAAATSNRLEVTLPVRHEPPVERSLRSPASPEKPVASSGRTEPSPSRLNPVTPLPDSSSRPATFLTHTVRRGDTFAVLSRKYGIPLNAISAANPGVDSRKLVVGQSVRIPAK